MEWFVLLRRSPTIFTSSPFSNFFSFFFSILLCQWNSWTFRLESCSRQIQFTKNTCLLPRFWKLLVFFRSKIQPIYWSPFQERVKLHRLKQKSDHEALRYNKDSEQYYWLLLLKKSNTSQDIHSVILLFSYKAGEVVVGFRGGKKKPLVALKSARVLLGVVATTSLCPGIGFLRTVSSKN